MKIITYRLFLIGTLTGMTFLGTLAERDKSSYIDWGARGTEFSHKLATWEKGEKWSDDDNFFISRVRPKQRFINRNTQVHPELNDENDKKLIFWTPINSLEWNALPDGLYDSEVFPMWSYITHYGNWSASVARIPGGFMDIAHRNGVPVSPLVAIPYGALTQDWKTSLDKLVTVGSRKLADYLQYYGIDGLGYNSEFSYRGNLVKNLGKLHEETVQIMKEEGNPLTEFIWYDGTNVNGSITFDNGIGEHNFGNWGSAEKPRASLFFNYNWNSDENMTEDVAAAKAYGRSPLDIYCGINMQGREPNNESPYIWTLLAKHPMSIGIWGAHSKNMFFESRAETGSSPDQRQRTYLNRMYRWFSGSSHNPITAPPLNNSLVYSSEGGDFGGMAKMMSARSSLKWDLSEEPFITYFSLGNGKFLNNQGIRSHDKEWYNISTQDYLPTWMWWFADSMLSLSLSPSNDLSADFTWEDAWNGGSTIKISGNAEDEILHLFKTEFELKDGDRIVFRHKILNGNGDIDLAISLKDNEKELIDGGLKIVRPETILNGIWCEKQYTVGKDFNLPIGSKVAVIALRFRNTTDLKMLLGELSIIRDDAMSHEIKVPIIEKSEVLYADAGGVDGKVIFNMPYNGNDVCYNQDVNTSYFKIYSQQEGEKPVFMGKTTSWAALIFSAPFDYNKTVKIRFGVSAQTLDHTAESEISWTQYYPVNDKYFVSDDLEIDKSNIHTDSPFTLRFVDPMHAPSTIRLRDKNGDIVAEKKQDIEFLFENGLSQIGMYDVEIVKKDDIVVMKDFLQIFPDESGEAPVILAISSNGKRIEPTTPESIEFDYDDEYVTLSYEADLNECQTSRGIKVGNSAVGFRFADTPLVFGESFSVSFSFCPDDFSDSSSHLFSIRDKSAKWFINNVGWVCHKINEDGTTLDYSIRDREGNTVSYITKDFRLFPGRWYDLEYIYNFDSDGILHPGLVCNGKTIELIPPVDENGNDIVIDGLWKEWSKNIDVSVGGYVHASGSVRGNIDNLLVKKGDDIIGYFDFEDNASSANTFVNKGSSNFLAGVISYTDTEKEGQGQLKWVAPDYVAGNPFTSGNSYRKICKINWDMPGATVVEQSNLPDGGMIKVRYPGEVIRMFPEGLPARLELTNDNGSDSVEVTLHPTDTSVINIKDNKDVVFAAYPSLFKDVTGVKSPVSGKVTLSLMDVDGVRLLSNDFDAEEGELLNIHPEVVPGVYILLLEQNGKNIGACRVLRK